MSEDSYANYFDQLFETARNLIRNADDHDLVTVTEVLDELSERFPQRFRVSSDTYEVLGLIAMLWQDPHIFNPGDDVIEFGWRDARPEHDSRFVTMWRERFHDQMLTTDTCQSSSLPGPEATSKGDREP